MRARGTRWFVNFTVIVGLGGCAAKLENPEAFAERSAAAGNGGAAGSAVGGQQALGGNPSPQGGDASAGIGPGSGASGAGGTSAGAAGGGASNAGAGGTVSGDLPACVAALFTSASSGKCSNGICHHAGADAPGGLDLASPGVKARLLDQPATHLGANPNTGCPKDDKLIDSKDPSASWLLKKVTLDGSVACGAKMPLTGSLTAEELSCLQQWVESF